MFFGRLLFGVILLTAFGVLGAGCSNQQPQSQVAAPPVDSRDESIVLDPFAPSPMVQNGGMYDKAVLKAADIKTLVVPDNAKVDRSGANGAIELYVRKTQSFGGHPPEPMTLAAARKHMGCAVKSEDGKVTLATYGEFSTKEGGSHMKVLVRVPAGLAVETQKGLSGPKSDAQRKQEGAYLTKESDTKEGYWYGPSSAGPGWKAIPMEPDPKQTANDAPQKSGEKK